MTSTKGCHCITRQINTTSLPFVVNDGKYKNTDNFIELLREFDDCCHDNVQDATCNSNDPDCPCMFCKK